MELDVDGRLAKEPLHRAFDPQDLLAEGGEVRLGVGGELLPDLGVLDQQDHAGRERVGGRLRAADEQVGHHLRVQLVVVQRAAPLRDLAVHERAQQRVVRLAAQLLEQRLEVMLRLDLREHRLLGLLVGLDQAHPLDPFVRPPLDLRQVLVGHADLPPDHVERQRHGVLRTHSQRAVAEEALEQLLGELLDVRVDLLDRRRPEGVVEHAAASACGSGSSRPSRLGAGVQPFSSYSLRRAARRAARSGRRPARPCPCCSRRCRPRSSNRFVSSRIALMSSYRVTKYIPVRGSCQTGASSRS